MYCCSSLRCSSLLTPYRVQGLTFRAAPAQSYGAVQIKLRSGSGALRLHWMRLALLVLGQVTCATASAGDSWLLGCGATDQYSA